MCLQCKWPIRFLSQASHRVPWTIRYVLKPKVEKNTQESFRAQYCCWSWFQGPKFQVFFEHAIEATMHIESVAPWWSHDWLEFSCCPQIGSSTMADCARESGTEAECAKAEAGTYTDDGTSNPEYPSKKYGRQRYCEGVVSRLDSFLFKIILLSAWIDTQHLDQFSWTRTKNSIHVV